MRIEKAKEIGFEDLGAGVEVTETASQEAGRFAPCLVTAIGLSRVPPQLEVPKGDLELANSSFESTFK